MLSNLFTLLLSAFSCSKSRETFTATAENLLNARFSEVNQTKAFGNAKNSIIGIEWRRNKGCN